MTKLVHDIFFLSNNLNVCEGHFDVYGKYAIIFTVIIQLSDLVRVFEGDIYYQ